MHAQFVAKFWLCLVKHSSIQTSGGVEVKLHTFLNAALHESHFPALFQETGLPASIVLVGGRGGLNFDTVWMLCTGDRFLSLPEDEIWCCIYQGLSLVTTLTELICNNNTWKLSDLVCHSISLALGMLYPCSVVSLVTRLGPAIGAIWCILWISIRMASRYGNLLYKDPHMRRRSSKMRQ